MAKPILISGIQPTGRLHLGNYLGALKNFVELQNSGKYQCYFFIADLHALTENPKPEDLRKNTLGLAVDFLAAGLDPKKSTIFQQSKVIQTAGLTWILSAIAPFGELNRMTQFKEKSASQKENINVGLFIYPILMSADILFYNAAAVPVGEDQLQHLELTRTIARKFNGKFGQTFTEPKPLITAAPRLMSLDDPTKKMSKSLAKGCVFIDDSSADIENKIKSAVTDSGNEIKYDPQSKPAISNLLLIYQELSGQPYAVIEKKFKGKGYSEFKKSLAEVISDHFAAFRKKKAALLKTSSKINTILNSGSSKARKAAEKKMAEVLKKIGLL